MIEIAIVAFGAPEFEQVAAIRRRVFVAEQGVPAAHEFDELEPEATHFLARCAGVPCGAARLYGEGGVARIGRVAVLAEYRKRGVGYALMLKALEVASQQGFTKVLIHSQTQAAPFYEKMGFVPTGEAFTEEEIPHIAMEKTLHEPPKTGG